jgi:HAD superfamily hydrolase (TIGR01549 family)
MPPSCLIFDFDGTIADTFQAILRISNRLADEFRYKKILPSEVDFYKGKSSQEMVRLLKVPRLKIPRIVARAAEELHYEIETIEPFAGLPEALRLLRDSGITLAILTSNSADNVSRFLKHHNMEYFDHIITASRIWGKNRVLEKMIRQIGWRKEEILYVGDETRDVEAAHKARVAVAAVTWGYNSHQALAERNPLYVIDRPEDLVSICQERNA